MSKKNEPALPEDIQEMPFEAALAELEGIIRKLEEGGVELEKSIALYERGASLKAHCEAKLRSAEERIEKIVKAGDGSVKAEPASFD
ncbi:MAG: exodeoxyribonuclease VII small subunit [Pseudomonadota bacterium]